MPECLLSLYSPSSPFSPVRVCSVEAAFSALLYVLFCYCSKGEGLGFGLELTLLRYEYEHCDVE